MDQMSHDPVLRQTLDPVDQVFPHQVFCERERSQSRLFDDFEARNVADVTPNSFKNLRHVDATVVLRQIRFEVRQVAAEVFFQQLNQRRIEAHFVFVQHEIERRDSTLTDKFHRHQQQRSPANPRVILTWLPSQESDRQKQRVRTTFGQVVLHSTVNGCQPGRQLLFRQRAGDLVTFECLACKFGVEVLVSGLPVQFGVAITQWILVGQRNDPQSHS